MINPWRVKQLTSTQSTNDDARRAAEEGEPEGLVIWALEQLAGRGRHDRQWDSPAGNLYLSLLLRPTCEARYVAQYAFMAAIAVQKTVKALLPNAQVSLKWPNDVLVQGKKISGILLESAQAPGGKIAFLVAGIGLNVEHFPSDATHTATSLKAEHALETSLSNILEHLLGHLAQTQETLEKQGFSAIRAEWTALAQKGPLKVQLPSGPAEGEFANLNEDGSLVLQLANGKKQAISAGDVFFK